MQQDCKKCALIKYQTQGNAIRARDAVKEKLIWKMLQHMFSQMFARAAYASVQYFITPITMCNFSNRTRFQSCANRFVSAWSAVENRCIRSVHQNVLDYQCCENISTLVIWTKMMMFYNVINSDYTVICSCCFKVLRTLICCSTVS